MPRDRIGLRRRVALALACQHVQELRPVQFAHVAQRAHERLDVVSVDRPDVVETHFLEQRSRQHHALQVLLRTARQLAHRGHLTQHLLAAFAQMRIRHVPRARWAKRFDSAPTFSEIDMSLSLRIDQQVGGQRAGVIQGFEGHAGGQGAVADDRHHASALARGARRRRPCRGRR